MRVDLIDVKTEYEALNAYLLKVGNDDDQQAMSELKQYVIDDEGSWALGENFPGFIGKWLNDDQPSNDDLRVKLLSVLSVAALKDDFILLLHQDRRDHVFMNYAHNVDRLPVTEQEALAIFVSHIYIHSFIHSIINNKTMAVTYYNNFSQICVFVKVC